jgi:eukaryotic-like serine/threonine-protein kinase
MIGDLRILEILGRGGMGTVYLAEGVERSAGQRVAVKVIAPHIADHPQVRARFEAEAQAVTRIDHPNVVKIHDYGVLSDGTLFHVMELLEGRELQQLLEERPPLSALQAAPFVSQICAGLQAAHDSGVVHRDLKPENIIILRERPLSLKLIDFGIAKLVDPNDWVQLTVTGMVMGTPLFIAPEQAMGDRARVGPRTDIYSLGVVLYAMLAGAPPFETEALGLLLAQHIKDPPPPLLERRPELSPAVAQVVHRCLEKDPAARFDSAQALAEAYLQALGGGLEGSEQRGGQDTVCDERPPAHMPPPAMGSLSDLGAATIVDAEPFTPPPVLSPATPTRRWSREMLAIGLAGGAILLIFVLLALTAYLVSG